MVKIDYFSPITYLDDPVLYISYFHKGKIRMDWKTDKEGKKVITNEPQPPFEFEFSLVLKPGTVCLTCLPYS